MTEETIFAIALKKPVTEQSVYLDEACAGNREMRRRIEDLLRAHAQAPGASVSKTPIEPAEEFDAQTLPMRPDAPASTGTTVRYFGDYELQEEIARGGMGVVFKARQVSLNRPVALKMILAGQLATEADVRRFRTEAEAAANLDHLNILPIYEVGNHNGQHYFSMKLIDGGSLADALREHRIGIRPAVQLLAKVARAVHFAHQRGILHRDLKPPNILLDRDGAAYITDFGLAKHTKADEPATGEAQMTQTGAILGTPGYMAPEQARAEKQLSTSIDVYALGAMLYEIIAGQPPFRGGTPLDIILQVINNDPVDPRKLNPRANRDLSVIALKCLEKEPAKRYGGAEALAEDLERWLRHEPIRALPVGVMQHGWRWCRRNPVIASLLVIITVSLLAGTTISLYYANQAHDRADQATRSAQQATIYAEQATGYAQQANRKADEAREALERLESSSYSQSIALARAELEANDVERELAVLEGCPINHRHWEWRYLHNLAHEERNSLPCQPGKFRTLAFRADGQVLAAGGGMTGYGPFVGDQEVTLWTFPDSVQKPFRAGKRKGAITGMAWSADGKKLALALWCMDDARDVSIGGENADEKMSGRIEIWDVEQGELLQTLFGHHSFVNAVGWSSDGRFVASGCSDRTAQVWDGFTGEKLYRLEGHRGQITALAFGPRNDVLATAGQGPMQNTNSQASNEGEIKLWDLETGNEKCSFEGHPMSVNCVAFSPDGNTLASASRDRTVKLWDVQSGRWLLTLYGHTGDVRAAVFLTTGNVLATAGSDRVVRLWNWMDGKPQAVLRGHLQPIQSIVAHPDGQHLASCAGQDQSIEVKVWDATLTSQVTVCAAAANSVQQIEVSPDGMRVLVRLQFQGIENFTWRMFDANTGKSLYDLASQPGSASFSADNSQLITIKGTRQGTDRIDVNIIDVRDGQLHSSLTLQQYEAKDHPFYYRVSPALSERGEWLVVADVERKEFVIHDCASRKEVRRLPFAMELDQAELFLSLDRRRLAAICDRRFPQEKVQWRTFNVTVWDTETGEILVSDEPKGFRADISRAQFSPDGRFLAVPGDGNRVRLWQPDLRTFSDLKLESGCRGLRFFPDGSRLVTVEPKDNRALLRIWNLSSQQERFALNGFAEGISFGNAGENLVFSPDGRRLFTACDGTVKVWDTDRGQLLLTQRSASGPIRLSDDGTRLVAAGTQGATLIWFAPP